MNEDSRPIKDAEGNTVANLEFEDKINEWSLTIDTLKFSTRNVTEILTQLLKLNAEAKESKRVHNTITIQRTHKNNVNNDDNNTEFLKLKD